MSYWIHLDKIYTLDSSYKRVNRFVDTESSNFLIDDGSILFVSFHIIVSKFSFIFVSYFNDAENMNNSITL